MAFTKISESELKSRGATTLPNQPQISASALKQEFDAPAKEVVAPKFNNLIDELEATTAAASIGVVTPLGRTGTTVQDVLNDISADIEEAVEDAHTHDNKEVLDKFSEDSSGKPTYDGSVISGAVESVNGKTGEVVLNASDVGALPDDTSIPSALADLTDDSTHRVVTDTEKSGWDAKADVSDIPTSLSGLQDDSTHRLVTDTEKTTWSGKSEVSVTQVQSSGTKIATVTVDGTDTDIYSPSGSGTGDMSAADYDPNETVKNAGGIVDYVASQAYELPTASASTKGGVMVGANLSIENDVLSATDTTYSEATTSASGLMSATDKTKMDGIEDGANNYSLPTASTSELGGVKVDGSSITINSSGVISATGGGGGGTTVIANPSGSATDDLEKVQIGATIYEIPDTTYESKQAAQGGTDVSLVTTGEKYTWNEKIGKSSTSGLVKNDGTIDTTQYISQHQDITGKADKVTGATSGNFAGLDANGNLTDSGSKASDFLTQHQSLAKYYKTDDGTITTLAANDIFPFKQDSSGEKHNIRFTKIREALKSAFDSYYFNTIETTGTASASDVCYQRIKKGTTWTEIYGTKYMETTTYSDSGDVRTFTFTNADITTDSYIDPCCNVRGVNPTDEVIASGSYTIKFNVSDGVTKVRIYIR